MTTPGEVALVLHTHLPYLRRHGVWPVGEEWLFQAWGTSWLPLTGMLLRLAEDGHRDVLTLGVTPPVAHQVADADLARDMGTWLGGQMWRSEEQRWHLEMPVEVRDLAHHHWRRFRDLLALHERVEAAGGLLAVWADLASRGVVELLGGPATHPYLPLVAEPALVDAQLATGLTAHAGWAGRRPTGLWAPEMGYRPRGTVADACAEPETVDRHGTPTLPRLPGEVPGLEEHYAAHGIDHVLVDAATLVRAAGGADRDWTRRPEVPVPGSGDPYEVVHDGVLVGDSDVVAYARDLSVAYHVWSPTAGYPGNQWYRDFFATGGYGVHPSWRVTSHDTPMDAKATYEPAAAASQVARHVAHLHGVLREVLDPRPGELVVAAYDTELFGHWWYEGVDWLEGLLRAVHADPRLTTTTLSSRRERRPPNRRLHLPESSWGYAKGHATWVTPETRPYWRQVREGVATAAGALSAGGLSDAASTQVARELAQLMCSDWPFMVTRGNSPDYAWARAGEHLALLAECADPATPPARVAELAALDDAPADVAPFLDALRALGDGARARPA
ncbi:MAG: 1,4-alpha-glucan branching protein domain-containing protein [Actinomycetes bacterium]